MRTRSLLVAWIAVALLLPAQSAHAGFTNLFAGDPATDTAEDSFTDDMGLEAIGTSTVRGGIICIVGAGVSDPGDNSLTCDQSNAYGTPNNYIGVGTFFLPIQPPPLRTGVFRLLGDGDADGTEPDTLSLPFTVSPCDSCDPAPALSIFTAWKQYAQPIAENGAIACALFNTEGDKDPKTLAKALVKQAVAETPNYVAIASAVGGFAFANLIDEAPQVAQLDKWLAVLHAVTCRATKMYQDIVADPPDPNYGIIDPPMFARLPPLPDEQVSRLAFVLDEIRAHGTAELTAVQRFEGAQAANAPSDMAGQAAAVGQNGAAMAQEMRDAAQQLQAFADRLATAGVGGATLAQADVDAASAFATRIHDQGFTQEETDQMTAAGLDSADQLDLRDSWGNEPTAPGAVGKTLREGIRSFAETLAAQADAEEGFAQTFAAYGPRDAPAVLTSTITSSISSSQLAPYAARFSGAASRPGTSPIVSYHWDFGDGATDDVVETSHLFTDPGVHYVTLTVTDADANTANTQTSVAVVGRDQLQLPVCPDGGGVVFQCAGFEQLEPGSALTVAGSGQQDVVIDHVLRGGGWYNGLVWFLVDDAAGTIDGLHPGELGWFAAAEARMHIAFDYPAIAPEQVTLHLQGGDHLALALTSGTSLIDVLRLNALNTPTTTAAFEFPFSAPNECHSFQVMPYRRITDGVVQLGYEDIPCDASDYTDEVFNVSGVTSSTPAELTTSATADSASVGPGGDDGYEVKVHNGAFDTVVLDSISDTLPAGFSYVASSTRGATTADPQISGQTLTWMGRFTAPGGGVAGLHFTVKAAPDVGTYYDSATADARGFALTPTGQTAPVTVVPPPSDQSGGGGGDTTPVTSQSSTPTPDLPKSTCRDHWAPVTTVDRRHSRFARSGISLVGLVTDKGCGPRGRGRVVKELIAISRRVGKRCQWLRADGSFGTTGTCARKTFLKAKGTRKWTLVVAARLRPGVYAVVVRGIDSAGNVERPVRGGRKHVGNNHNHYIFTLK